MTTLKLRIAGINYLSGEYSVNSIICIARCFFAA
jgi:hypothetical protein